MSAACGTIENAGPGDYHGITRRLQFLPFATEDGIEQLKPKWFELIRAFRVWEEADLIKNDPDPETLGMHCALMMACIKHGEILRTELAAKKIDTRDLDAWLEELDMDLNAWHGGMPVNREEEILRNVFGVK